jgi:hypothetical protein
VAVSTWTLLAFAALLFAVLPSIALTQGAPLGQAIFGGVVLSGIPFGWRFFSRFKSPGNVFVTPGFFVFWKWAKLVLSAFTGWLFIPFGLYQAVKELRTIAAMKALVA